MIDRPVHIGDSGTAIEAEIGTRDDDGVFTALDVSDATSISIIIRKPSGTKNTETGAFSTDGTDGKVRYLVSSTSYFDQAGTWWYEAKVVRPLGTWWSTPASFEVVATL